jgi:hypothetical protein
MPAHVALQHLHHVVVVFFQPQGAVRFDVADRGHLEFERPEALGEGDLLVAREMLVGKDQQRVLEPGGVERAPGGVVQLRDLDAADYGAEAGVERFDIESACHVGPPG